MRPVVYVVSHHPNALWKSALMLALVAFCAAVPLARPARCQGQPALTNAQIVAMVKAGLPPSVLLAKIRTSTTAFDTSPAALEQLKADGVPDAVIVAIVDSAGGPVTRPAVDPIAALFRLRQSSVVTVWSAFGQGTGFLISRGGLVLTNQHVVGPSTYISVQSDANHKVRARLLAADAQRDVAVLWINTAGLPGVLPAPLAPRRTWPGVVIGEEVFTVGTPMGVQKVLTTGIVSRIEPHAIFSNIDINHGNSGGPLFNSRGQVVGITTFLDTNEPSGPGISGIITLDQAEPVIERAEAAMSGSAPPSATQLPVLPSDSFPIEALKEVAARPKFNTKPYTFSEGKFRVVILTPPLEYWAREYGDMAAIRSRARRNKGMDAMRPLDNLKNWAQYVGAYDPVIQIRVDPKLRQTFWSAFGRGMAAAAHDYTLPPERLHYITDFSRMVLLCGERPVQPILPGKIASLLNVHNPFVNVSDATYQGLYTYPADAISPRCGRVTLEIYSEKHPDKPTRKTFNEKTVQRVWRDFEPYRVQQAVERSGQN